MGDSKHESYESICSIGEEIINTEELNLLLKISLILLLTMDLNHLVVCIWPKVY